MRELGPLQARAFGLTWLSYASYYATRKNFSVAKSSLEGELHVGVGWLGAIDTAYLVAYAAGQFVHGALGDRIGARRMIAAGMLASAAASAGFGLASSPLVFLLVFGANGLFQATGWPNNVKVMGAWFGRRLRGRVMGLWSTNYQLGGIAASAAAATLLVWGWRATFLFPAVWTGLVGVVVLLLLVERPADRALPAPDEDAPAPGGGASSAAPAAEAALGATPARSPFGAMIRLPAVWILGSAYFGLKLIRYTLLFWLPYFLTRLGYDARTAGFLSIAFEAGGLAGSVAIGWLADRAFASNPLRLVVPVLVALAGALFVLRGASTLGGAGIVASLAAVGFLLFGPDTLISGAAAQNLGRSRATASAAGIINGFGSIGAACQGAMTTWVSQAWGWEALFLVLVGAAILSALALTPLALRPRA